MQKLSEFLPIDLPPPGLIGVKAKPTYLVIAIPTIPAVGVLSFHSGIKDSSLGVKGCQTRKSATFNNFWQLCCKFEQFQYGSCLHPLACTVEHQTINPPQNPLHYQTDNLVTKRLYYYTLPNIPSTSSF